MIGPNSLLKNVLVLPIGHFYLATSLRVVSCCHLVFDSVAQKSIKLLIPKIRATVTNNSTWESKPAKDVALDQLDHNFVVISVSGHCFDHFET